MSGQATAGGHAAGDGPGEEGPVGWPGDPADGTGLGWPVDAAAVTP